MSSQISSDMRVVSSEVPRYMSRKTARSRSVRRTVQVLDVHRIVARVHSVWSASVRRQVAKQFAFHDFLQLRTAAR